VFLVTFLSELCCSRNRAVNPPPSSSLAEERTPLLIPPPCGGARFPTLAARGPVWSRRYAHRAVGPPTSSSLAGEKHACSLLLSTAGARLPCPMARSARSVSRLAAAFFVVARGRNSVSARSSSPRRRAKRALAAHKPIWLRSVSPAFPSGQISAAGRADAGVSVPVPVRDAKQRSSRDGR
jgi:hypothetical protein